MDFSACWQWLLHANFLFYLFAYLVWLQLLHTIREMYTARQNRLSQEAMHQVKLEEIRQAASRSEGNRTEGEKSK